MASYIIIYSNKVNKTVVPLYGIEGGELAILEIYWLTVKLKSRRMLSNSKGHDKILLYLYIILINVSI